MAKTTNETTIYTRLGQINTALVNAFSKFKTKNATQDTAITNLQTAVNTMTGGFNYRGACNFKMADPNKAGYRDAGWTNYSPDNMHGATIQCTNYLSAFVQAMDPDKTLEKGDAVINEFDNKEWWYNGSKWINLGTASVSTATATTPGIVKGTSGSMGANTNAGYIGVDADGKMFVNGWDDEKNRQDNALTIYKTANDTALATYKTATNATLSGHTQALSDHEIALGDVGTALNTIITTLEQVTAV